MMKKKIFRTENDFSNYILVYENINTFTNNL